MANKNIRSLSYRKELDDNLFENISELAKKTASEEKYHELAERFMIDDSVVFGTASFYDFLRPENQHKTIHVCNGTACMVAGTQDKLTDNLKGIVDADKIGHAPCLGHCHHSHAFMFDDKTYSASTKEELTSILSSRAESRDQKNSYHIDSNTTAILTSKIDNISNFYALAEKF